MAASGESSIEQVGAVVQTEMDRLPFEEIEVAREYLAQARQVLNGVADHSEAPALQGISADLAVADKKLSNARNGLQEGQAKLTEYLRHIGLSVNPATNHSSQRSAVQTEVSAPVEKTSDPSLHEPCAYVTQEVGSPATEDSLQLLLDTGVAREIAFRLVQEQDTYPIDHSKRLGALALDALDCAGCQIADGCPVSAYLDGYVMLEEIAHAAGEPQHVPDFITIGRERRHRETMALSEVADSLRALSRGVVAAPLEIDLQDIRESHGNIRFDRSAPRRQYSKAELDEVGKFAAIADRATFVGIHMITSAGRRFELIDARHALPFKGEPLQENEFAILCSKLLGRIVELGPDGEPSICNPDSKMQKIIKSVPGGMVYELRMTGKSRIYFTVRRIEGNSGSVLRVVLLGGHGGDARTQREFIDNVLRLEK